MLNTIRDMGQSLFVKFIFGAIILTFIFWGVSARNIGSGNAVATVNGEQISLLDYSKAIRTVLRNPQVEEKIRGNEVAQEQLRREVLQRLISDEVTRQEANRLGILVTPQELYYTIAAMDVFKGADGKFDKDTYVKLLAAQGVTPGDFEAQQLDELLRRKLYKYMLSTVSVSKEETRAYFDFYREERKADYLLFSLSEYKNKVSLNDSDIETYYTEHKETFRQPARINLEYVRLTPETLAGTYPATDEEIASAYETQKEKFTVPAQFKQRHIIITDTGNPAEREKNKAQLEAIRKEIVAGADFAKKAQEVSDDKENFTSTDEAEWTSEDQLIPVLSAELNKLKIGETSEVIELPNAFVIFKVEERKDSHIKPLSEVKQLLSHEISSQKVLDDYKKIETKAEDDLREGKTINAIAEEFNVPLGSTGLIPLANSTDSLGLLQSAEDTLRVVMAGKLVPMPLSVENGLVLVKVIENIPAGIPELAKLKDSIKETVLHDKANALAKEDAEKALSLIKNNNNKLPKDFSKVLKHSERALRASPNKRLTVEPLGEATALVNDLFINAKGAWLPHVYEVKEGVAIAKVSDIQTGSEEEWNMYQKTYADGLLLKKNQQAELAFIQSLLLRGKITQDLEKLKLVPLS